MLSLSPLRVEAVTQHLYCVSSGRLIITSVVPFVVVEKNISSLLHDIKNIASSS